MRNQEKNEGRRWTILDLIRRTSDFFKSRNIEAARPSAEILLAHCLGMDRVGLYANFDKPLTALELGRYREFVKRRANREPAAYITGRKEFWSLDLSVTPDVLIPRPETEHLVEASLASLSERPENSPKRVLELGTGSGAVTLALASETPGNTYIASDRSLKALQVARENAIRLHLDQYIQFISGDWFAPLSGSAWKFDIILSNPPYIKTSDLPGLEPEIREYEPVIALDGKEDGLSAIRHIIMTAPDYLNDSGILLMEIGYGQKKAVSGIAMERACYTDISFIKDYAGHDRIVRIGRR